jgi:hypothetical protein
VSHIEIIAFGTLWIVFGGLILLVAILYRQLDKAYARAEEAGVGALDAGVAAPELDILAPDGEETLSFPPGLVLLAFVNSNCAACATLLSALRETNSFRGLKLVVISGPDSDELKPFYTDPGDVRFEWLAHPADATRVYGVRRVPFVYVLYDGTILGSRVGGSTHDLEELLRIAEDAQSTMNQDRPLVGA